MEHKVEREEKVEAEVHGVCNESRQGFLSNMVPIRESCPSGRICRPRVWTPSQSPALVHKNHITHFDARHSFTGDTFSDPGGVKGVGGIFWGLTVTEVDDIGLDWIRKWGFG